MLENKKFTINKNDYIAYRQINQISSTHRLVFFPGLKSNMNSSKASHVQNYCQNRQLDYLCFDYLGHGESSGTFEDFNMSDWLNSSLAIIDKFADKPLIFVGSSMGAWLMLLIAKQRPLLTKSIVSIAAAPDFTDKLIWQKLSPDAQNDLIKKGFMLLNEHNDYEPIKITHNLIEDGKKHLILSDQLNIACPCYLLHGMSDKDVPYDFSLQLAEILTSQEIEVRLVKEATHSFSTDKHLEKIDSVIDKILKNLEEY